MLKTVNITDKISANPWFSALRSDICNKIGSVENK